MVEQNDLTALLPGVRRIRATTHKVDSDMNDGLGVAIHDFLRYATFPNSFAQYPQQLNGFGPATYTRNLHLYLTRIISKREKRDVTHRVCVITSLKFDVMAGCCIIIADIADSFERTQQKNTFTIRFKPQIYK